MINPIELPKRKFEWLFALFYTTGMLVWFAIGYLTCVKIVYSSVKAFEQVIRK